MDICLGVATTTDEPALSPSDDEQSALDLYPAPSDPSLSVEQHPDAQISEEEAQMAVALTEYFQEQRKVYEQVC